MNTVDASKLSAVFVDASFSKGGKGAEGCEGYLSGEPDGESGWGGTFCFGAPLARREAWTLDEVAPVVAWAEAECRAGRWVVLALAYEAAPAFDAALCAHPAVAGLPLAWAASHAEPLPAQALPAWLASGADYPVASRFAAAPDFAPGPVSSGGLTPGAPVHGLSPGPSLDSSNEFSHRPWRALVPPSDYAARFGQLQEWIAQGETYQANYTLPFACRFTGSGLGWFAALARGQAAGFCAWLDLGRHEALSFSPELFFRLEAGGEVLARPMKGTAPRGGSAEEDASLRAALGDCPKNRAENVMIVDLLRSDLGRVALPGSVRTPRLFQVEAYPTVFQMTSDVRARLRPGVGLLETLAALFPCGSVTGAPKVRTMQLLRSLEPHPRGLYCGAIGLLRPSAGGELRGTFSVPIRTIVLDRDTAQARFCVGGGITHDSTLCGEYAELQDKMRFLVPPAEDFELLEALLLVHGRIPLFAGHLERLGRSAEHFGFPADGIGVLQTLEGLARANPQGRHKLRLTLSRSGALLAEAAPISGGRTRVRLGFAAAGAGVDSGDELLAHKTTLRAVYERALASRPDCDDVLLLNERGEVTESSRANLVLRLEGELVTPPLCCGLLPGVFRQRLLEYGIVRERVLVTADVLRAERVWLVNSVRWWMDCELVGCEAGD
ncbi:chorismate-binding protein [Humidesulfovibrio sp.]